MCLICAHSPLSDLLDKEDYTLEQVLEEDELIQEVKSRNVKLLQFLSKEETVRKLVYYVTRKAEDGDGDMIAIKYPFMSCEVLCCDIMCITETLSTASNGAIVEDLFGLLSQPAPLNSRLAGYFEKVILSLLMIRKPQEVTELMNKNADTLLDGFVTHSISYSIAEMFKRLMQPYQGDYMDDMDFSHPYGSNGGPWFSSSSDEDDLSAVGTPQSKKTLSWQTDRRVVDSLVQNLRPADDKDDPIDSDVHKHTAEILSDIIHYGTRSSANEPAPASATLVEHIESAETVDKIIALALPAGNAYTTSMTSALTVLSALLSRHANTHYSSTIPEETPVVVSATVARLPQIAQALRDEAGTTVNQRHQTVPKLGLRRLKLVGLLVVLVQAKYRAIDAVILSENIIAQCLDLFFTFESVNMLHAEIESLVVGILESGGPDLQVGLLKQSNLLGRILQAYETNTAALQESPANAKGYMGHLLRISNVILNITDEVKGVDTRGSLNDMTHADSIVEYLEADPMWAQWDEFVKTTVADANDKDRHALGGSVVSHPVNIQTLSQDDPYGIGRFDHPPIGSFADMLESGDQSHFDTDFDLPQDNDIPAMISDSSSSDEDEDFTEFDPRSIHRSNHPQDSNVIPVVPLDSPDLVMEQADKSMDNSNWANFDAAVPSSQEYVVSCGGACLRSV
ncbi:hypothetical protein DYB37_003520 [Aphanomyces astaci]|uniref:Uncharacterized protein n=1 Tax=Aphanomyces astaci TaxID=112090 RepID=A0A3R6XT15_APHAT|nr:hypothetical protein DYB35_003822 [Aphanomyces astaci]RHZ33999.1 hypothetical protein DYB37_003520 [Aphanomyces astaci]